MKTDNPKILKREPENPTIDLGRFIDHTPIDTSKLVTNMFKGRDGKSYSDSESLRLADEAWKRQNLQYKGRDGNFYSTTEALDAADEAWKRQNLRFKGVDGKEYATSKDLEMANRAYWDAQIIKK